MKTDRDASSPAGLFLVHRLTRALQTIELRPTYEDVLPVESTSVEEYLEQMHETTTMAAIQVQSPTVAHCSSIWLYVMRFKIFV